MAKSSPARTKKVASPPSHPKYEDMIRDAIVALKERKGSSRQAIKKYILSTYKLPDNGITNNRLRLAINKGVDKGVFAFPNGPSGTLKLVKKEPVKKEKKEVEKKEKPKKTEKKEVKTAKAVKAVKPKAEKVRKAATRKTSSRKTATSTPTKKSPAKPKKTSTATKKTRASTAKKASEKRTGTRRKAASS